jgi:hypothetical protein
VVTADFLVSSSRNAFATAQDDTTFVVGAENGNVNYQVRLEGLGLPGHPGDLAEEESDDDEELLGSKKKIL